jgi:hypothetical protein
VPADLLELLVTALLGEALTATSDITDVHRRAEAWAAIAAHLTASGRTGEPQQTR